MAANATREALDPVALVLGGLLYLGGCVPLLVADAASEAATGKTFGGHALSGITHKDCNVLEGALRADRKVCEEPGAPATEKDFKGVDRPRRSDDEKTSDGP
jgi:hypothetical protein